MVRDYTSIDFWLALSAFSPSLILNAIQTLRGHVLGDWPARRGQRVQRSTIPMVRDYTSIDFWLALSVLLASLLLNTIQTP
jgi:hypothetical protein